MFRMRKILKIVVQQVACSLIVALISANICVSSPLSAQAASHAFSLPQPNTLQLRQMQQHPLVAFMHFSIATFVGVDNPCGKHGCPSASKFAPIDLPASGLCNVSEWVATAKEMGATQICLTAHHGAGFTLWRSNVSDYGVKSSSYATDLLAEFAAACRAAGMSICYYWDLGDGYDAQRHMSPSALAARQTQWLTEILRQQDKYGPVDRLWLDDYGGREYLNLTRLVETLSPHTLMVPGPHGWRAGASGSFGQYPLYHTTTWDNDTGTQPQGWSINGTSFMVRETDMTIQSELDSSGVVHGEAWFWRNKAPFLSAPQLWDYYISTVMRGGALIINIPPSVYCGVPPKYRQVGAAFGAAVADAFHANAYVAVGGNASAPCSALSVTVPLPTDNSTGFNGVVLQEDLTHGQRITQYTISVLLDEAWVQVPSVGSSAVGPAAVGVKGGTIGPSSLDLLPAEYCRSSEVTAVRWQCVSAIADPVSIRTVAAVLAQPPSS
eukprot:m.727962 g.727962  ORF g.727962 m.727962 type:complete len:495 (+) comp23041_c0_seq2:163-1647(+)